MDRRKASMDGYSILLVIVIAIFVNSVGTIWFPCDTTTHTFFVISIYTSSHIPRPSG